MKVFKTDERIKRISERFADNPSAVDIVKRYLEMMHSVPEIDLSGGVSGVVSPEESHEVVQPLVSNPVPDRLAGFIPGDEEYVPFIPVSSGPGLFSDDAKARRRLKQMYAESGFRKNAVSKAGARGLFQIMPITEKDYVTRGKGKKGDVFDPEYNEGIRDYVFSVIPKDLGEFWSDDDSEENRLAKLYAAYNWGAGNLRKYLRKQRESGVDISDPESWVVGLNPETRNYVTFLALDRDVPGTGLTNEAFESSAMKNGYMREGGNLFRAGGPKKQGWFTRMMMNSVLNDPNSGPVATSAGWTRDKEGSVYQTEESANSEGAKRLRAALAEIAAMPLTDLVVDVAGAAVVGTKTYKSIKLARELNKMLKSGEFDAAVDMAREASKAEPIVKASTTLPAGYPSSSDYSLTRVSAGLPAAEQPVNLVSLPDYAGQVRDAVKAGKWGNLRFYRNIDGVPYTTDSGLIRLGKDENALVNVTSDLPFRLHSDYKAAPGAEYLVIDPDAFIGKTPLSIEPMDTFFPNVGMDVEPKYVKIITGNKEIIPEIESKGMKALTSPELQDLYSKIGGDFGSDAAAAYRDAVDKYITENIGRPSLADYAHLEEVTGLKSGTVPLSEQEVYNAAKKASKEVEDTYNWMSKMGLDSGKYFRGLSEDIRWPYTYANGRDVSAISFSKEPIIGTGGKVFYDTAPPVEAGLMESLGSYSHPNIDRLNSILEFSLDPSGYHYFDPQIGKVVFIMPSPIRASGGKIHIKPENRGKFTALKKRTGHSASWFKAHGTPAQKKMAVFALNASKWKHDEGGDIEREPDRFTARDNTYVSSLVPETRGFIPAEERPLPPSLGLARLDDGIVGAFPYLGDALQAGQAITDASNGDIVTGLQTAGLLLAPNVLEKPLRGLFRKGPALRGGDLSDDFTWINKSQVQLDASDYARYPGYTRSEVQDAVLKEIDDARAIVRGDIPQHGTLSHAEYGVTRPVPENIKEQMRRDTKTRMLRERKMTKKDAEEFSENFDKVIDKTYTEVPSSVYDKAGKSPQTQGSRNRRTGKITMREGRKPEDVVDHELRHEIQNSLPLTNKEKTMLEEAYGDDFRTTGVGGKTATELSEEDYTTNLDARKTLLGDDINLPVDEQNEIISDATDLEIGMALHKSNGYGQAFVKKLVDEGKFDKKRVAAIKKAMMRVGAVGGVGAASSYLLYKGNDQDMMYGDGGKLNLFEGGGYSYGKVPLLYDPQPQASAETPVPYSEEGYKEQQFYDDPANRITYLVQPGDTSWGIANQNRMPLGTLLKMNPGIGTGERIYPGQKLSVGYKEYVPDTPKQKIETDDSMYYSVQKGDYLGKIAKDNGMSLESLLKLNPQFVGREDQINVGEKVNIGTPSVGKNRQFKTMKERREWEAGLDNVGAIQNYKHDKNYAIIDKNAQTLTVYDPDNRVVRRFHVNTGSSNQDYNTKTYEDDKGHILYGQGNMSTPAGITEIVSVGKDYGHNSFVRARVGNDGKVRNVRDSEGNLVNDTIASSIHYEKGLYGPNASNGCVRMEGKDVDALKDYLSVGSRVYTLPQSKDKDGNASSWFKLEDGKLSFYASDPVGETDNTGFEPQPVYEKGKIKKDKNGNVVYRDFAAEDDYNQSIDMTAGPLYSSYQVSDEPQPEYQRNRAIFATTLSDNKRDFMKELIDNGIGVNSDTYNRLAELAMAIANQESKFGTSTTFIAKSAFPDVVRKVKGEEGAMSIGATQMKYAGYNDEVKKILKNLGIDTSKDTRNQWDIANSAKATLALLAYFYNEQLTPAHRRRLKAQGMSEEEALAMMFNGKSVKWLEEFTSDPDWRVKMHNVPSLPGGLLRRHFNKDVLVADYANKTQEYLKGNEPFYKKNGGIIEKLSKTYSNNPDIVRDLIAKARKKQQN